MQRPQLQCCSRAVLEVSLRCTSVGRVTDSAGDGYADCCCGLWWVEPMEDRAVGV